MTMHMRITSGKPGTASRHVKYILRKGEFSSHSKSNDLVQSFSGNLPPNVSDPVQFFSAADKGERKNGAAYREMVLAVPRELTDQQNVELGREFIAVVLPGRPYVCAYHKSIASLDRGLNPHFHIVYSDRIMDGIEREPEAYFHRFNKRHPAQGGCKKASGGQSPVELREELKEVRSTWAELQNTKLQESGHQPRMDPRSHFERGLKTLPEIHLGPAHIRGLTDAQKEEIRDSRASSAKE